MNPETRSKITKGLKTTEFWVVLLMGVLTTIMVTVQEHSTNVLPIELQMKILGGLATAYVVCRTALKLAGLVATILRLDKGESLPVPLPPAGVKLPEVQLPIPGALSAVTVPPAGPVLDQTERAIIAHVDPSWTDLRDQELKDQAAADERAFKLKLRRAGEEPTVVIPQQPGT